MVDLDEGEARLFAKYWGDNDLVNNEEFWDDVFEYYSKEPRNASMPIKYTPLTVRKVQGMLNCPPGECGKCCKTYGVVSVSPDDRHRITENTECTEEELLKILTIDEKGVYINSKENGHCPFLENDACKIYDYRPDTCWLYPFGFKEATLGGKLVQQMVIRIKCRPALDVARTLITQAMREDKLLLPDLTIIPKGEK